LVCGHAGLVMNKFSLKGGESEEVKLSENCLRKLKIKIMFRSQRAQERAMAIIPHLLPLTQILYLSEFLMWVGYVLSQALYQQKTRAFCKLGIEPLGYRGCYLPLRKVDIRLPGKRNSNSHGARPVY